MLTGEYYSQNGGNKKRSDVWWKGCKWEAGRKEYRKEERRGVVQGNKCIRANSAGRDRAHPPGKDGHTQHGQVGTPEEPSRVS